MSIEGKGFLEDLEICFNELLGEPAGSLALKRILARHRGSRVWIPGLTRFYRDWRNRQIKNEFKGDNFEEIALKWNLSVKHVERIVKN